MLFLSPAHAACYGEAKNRAVSWLAFRTEKLKENVGLRFHGEAFPNVLVSVSQAINSGWSSEGTIREDVWGRWRGPEPCWCF